MRLAAASHHYITENRRMTDEDVGCDQQLTYNRIMQKKNEALMKYNVLQQIV